MCSLKRLKKCAHTKDAHTDAHTLNLWPHAWKEVHYLSAASFLFSFAQAALELAVLLLQSLL